MALSCSKKTINIIRVLLNPPTTDASTTDHLPTDQPTHRPPTHRLTDPKFTDKILFQKLDNWKKFILQNTNTAGKM